MSSDLSATNEAAQSIEPAQSLPAPPVEQAWFGLCLFALFLATSGLWLGNSGFPQVPWFWPLRVVGVSALIVTRAGLALLTVVLVSLIVGLWPRRLPSGLARWLNGEWLSSQRDIRTPTPFDSGSSPRLLPHAWASLLVLLIVLVLPDQNRLQPWVWHGMLVSAMSIGTCRDPERWRRGVLWLTVSLYAWSAWSKFDASFLDSYGQQFIESLYGADNIQFRWWKPQDRQLAAAVLPLGEFAVALTMLVPSTRKFGCGLSIVMHLGLMAAVGPLGLNHLPGVFLWNIYFIGQNALLLKAARRATPIEPGADLMVSPTRSSWGRLNQIILASAILLPGLKPWGYCDNWPAWAVYASGIEHVTIYVAESAVDRLPDGARKVLEESRIQSGWRAVRIEQWALQSCRAPIYPQDRFFMGVALWLADEAALGDDELIVLWRGPSDRFSGQREVITLRGANDVRRFAERYQWNLKAVSRQ